MANSTKMAIIRWKRHRIYWTKVMPRKEALRLVSDGVYGDKWIVFKLCILAEQI